MMINEYKNIHLRHELKYRINETDAFLLSQRLKKIFLYDKHADSRGIYRVNSLYFDTPYDKALRQKIDGVNAREKFRIRYYNENLSFIRLEKKIKINGLCGKRSTQITEEQVRQLMHGDIRFLLESSEPLFLELYSKMQGQVLRPKTIVSYEREAYYFGPGNVRITIDRNICSGLGNLDFLNSQIYCMNVSGESTVLEVKYDEFLPELAAIAIQVPNRQSSAFSKYAVCRQYD